MDQYGLIGFPLGHSFSASYFNEKFQNEGIDAQYANYELERIDNLSELIDATPDLRGFNVTIPYKQAVIDLLDGLSDEAREIGAVNVVKVVRDKGKIRLVGFNSDVTGFMESIRPLLMPHHRKALVLGTGGASRAVVYGLRKLGLETLSVSRTKGDERLTYQELDDRLLGEYTVIVNTTPLGMFPQTDTCPDIPYHAISPRHLLYDVVYNPEETTFLRKGRAEGAMTKNGLEMLILQAMAAWEIWNRPDEKILSDIL